MSGSGRPPAFDGIHDDRKPGGARELQEGGLLCRSLLYFVAHVPVKALKDKRVKRPRGDRRLVGSGGSVSGCRPTCMSLFGMDWP